MGNCEKQVEQEAAYPILISLYIQLLQDSESIAMALLMPHYPVTVVKRYKDGACSLLFHLFFIICHPYIPLNHFCIRSVVPTWATSAERQDNPLCTALDGKGALSQRATDEREDNK